MCTLTIIPTLNPRTIARVVMNRDEQRTRPHALPPRVIDASRPNRPGVHIEPRPPRCIMPTDPQSGGTWIAATDAGLVFALLNVNPPTSPPATDFSKARLSRGVIIPRLATQTSINHAAAAALALDLDRFPPFRLIITDGTQLIELISSAAGPILNHTSKLRSPFFATSSGLGDHHVDPPRREHFNRLFAAANPKHWPELQEGFHLSRSGEAPQLGVLMSRSEASTVSITSVDLNPAQVVMRYHAVDDQFTLHPARLPPLAHTLALDRAPLGVAVADPLETHPTAQV